MKINMQKTVQVEPKMLSICTKVSDRFTCQINDQDGKIIADQDDGYVPDFMPGEHYGDYIILEIELDTGIVKNWVRPTAEQIEEFIKRTKGEEE